MAQENKPDQETITKLRAAIDKAGLEISDAELESAAGGYILDGRNNEIYAGKCPVCYWTALLGGYDSFETEDVEKRHKIYKSDCPGKLVFKRIG